jgi:type II secretory pathway component PulK
MQRKNNILTPSKSSKNGIAMIMAIMIIVIIGTIMALSISMTALTTKSTNDIYLYEQSELFSKSATEYALLRIAEDNNDSDPCHYTGGSFTQDSIYNINISVKYIYLAGVCTNQYATVSTDEQNGSVLIDVAVDVNDTISGEPIRYFRRTLQKL